MNDFEVWVGFCFPLLYFNFQVTEGKGISCIFYLFKFKVLFQEKSLCFTSRSGTFSIEMNQKDPGKCELTFFFFFLGNRWESDIKCFCPDFHVDDKLSCFLEFLGNNYDQICFCSIHMPSYFPTTHPFSASLTHGCLFFFFHKNNHTRKTQIQIRNIRIVKAVLSESRILYHSTSTLNEGCFFYVELWRIHILRHWAKNNRFAFLSMELTL